MKKVIIAIFNKIKIMIWRYKFEIGKGCFFGKITFWDCEKNAVKIGENVLILRNTEICGKKENPVIIGNNVFINQRCILRPNLTLSDNVSVGPNVLFLTDSHEIGNSDRRAGKQSFNKIQIGEGVWIGGGSIILGNVKIGSGTIIAAGSVVIKDCESNSLYAGVPAKKIKNYE